MSCFRKCVDPSRPKTGHVRLIELTLGVPCSRKEHKVLTSHFMSFGTSRSDQDLRRSPLKVQMSTLLYLTGEFDEEEGEYDG